MPEIITAGATTFGSWTAWTPVQHGTTEDRGYVACPPGVWVTPQRAIVKAGDLIGVRAACSSVCGELSVQFSLDGGVVLTITTPTVETDEWGKTLAYWFALPSGLSAGRHEIRARLVPSVAGLERVLQGSTSGGQEWTTRIGPQTSSLVVVIDPEEFYVVVAAGGANSGGSSYFKQKSTNAGNVGVESIEPSPLGSIGYASEVLAAAMAASIGSQAAHGGTIYVKEGSWNANVAYLPSNLWWLTIKRHPAAAVGAVKITGANTNASPMQAAWVKYQNIDFDLSTAGNKIYCASGANNFWIDNCRLMGAHQTLSSSAVITNDSNRFVFMTNNYVEHLDAQGAGVTNPALVRHAIMDHCTSDIFTQCHAVIGFTITNHRSLNNGTDINGNPYSGLDQHGDLKQQIPGASLTGAVLCDGSLLCISIAGDNGTALFNSSSDVTQNTYVENIFAKGLTEGSGDIGFWGGNPIGCIIRHCNVEKPLSMSEWGGTLTWRACEITNSVWTGAYIPSGFYSRLKTNGSYSGNHNVSSTGSDSTDTTGAAAMDSNGIPTYGGNLQGRNRMTLTDASGYRRADPTYAGAYSPLLDRVIPPIATPDASIVATGRQFSMTVPSGLTCRYTTNGVDPTISTGTAYSGALSLTEGITFTIRNFHGSDLSVTTTAAYQVITDGTPAPPRLTP